MQQYLTNELLKAKWEYGEKPQFLVACQNCGDMRIVTLGEKDSVDTQTSLIGVCHICFPSYYESPKQSRKTPRTRVLIGYSRVFQTNSAVKDIRLQENIFSELHSSLDKERDRIWTRASFHFTAANALLALLGIGILTQLRPDILKLWAWSLSLLMGIVCWKWYIVETQGLAIQAFYHFFNSVLEKYVFGTFFNEMMRSDEGTKLSNSWPFYLEGYFQRQINFLGRIVLRTKDLVSQQYFLPLVYFLVPLLVAITLQFL